MNYEYEKSKENAALGEMWEWKGKKKRIGSRENTDERYRIEKDRKGYTCKIRERIEWEEVQMKAGVAYIEEGKKLLGIWILLMRVTILL